MAVPGSPLNPRSDGGNQLIRDTATLEQHATDVIACVSHKAQVEIPPAAPDWADGMRQNIDQTAVDDISVTLLRDLSFDQVDIDDLISWCAQPTLFVWAAILELEIAWLVTQHYGNHVAHIAPQ